MGRISEIDHDTGVVTQFDKTERGKCHINDLVREIKSSQVIDTPIMPEGSLSYTQNGSVKIFFVQREESLVPVQYGRRVYSLAWPVQIYGIIIDNLTPLEVCMYFAKKIIDHEFDEVAFSCLPNQYDTGRLCMGRGLSAEVAGASTYVEVIRKIVHWIRTASFNDDLSGHEGHVPIEFKQAVGQDRGWHPDNRQIFEAWEKWTQEAGEEWRNINRLSWHNRGHFNEVRRGFRS